MRWRILVECPDSVIKIRPPSRDNPPNTVINSDFEHHTMKLVVCAKKK